MHLNSAAPVLQTAVYLECMWHCSLIHMVYMSGVNDQGNVVLKEDWISLKELSPDKHIHLQFDIEPVDFLSLQSGESQTFKK